MHKRLLGPAARPAAGGLSPLPGLLLPATHDLLHRQANPSLPSVPNQAISQAVYLLSAV